MRPFCCMVEFGHMFRIREDAPDVDPCQIPTRGSLEQAPRGPLNRPHQNQTGARNIGP